MQESKTIEVSDIGVIVGRFQVPLLTKGHDGIIREVASRHSKLIILIGCSPVHCTKENPLDFPTRKWMVEALYPNAVVLPIMDQASDAEWSVSLDRLVRTAFPVGTVSVYGGRDSFLPFYSGQFQKFELPTIDYRPGTEVRRAYGNLPIKSEEARRGAIYVTQNQFPTAYMCVDVVVLDKINILLVRKPGECGWRLPGGFLNPGETLEAAAVREVMEETGVSVGEIQYISSLHVNDWRYTKSQNKITTALFKANYTWGAVDPKDDVNEAEWFPVSAMPAIERVHVPLIQSWRGE